MQPRALCSEVKKLQGVNGSDEAGILSIFGRECGHKLDLPQMSLTPPTNTSHIHTPRQSNREDKDIYYYFYYHRYYICFTIRLDIYIIYIDIISLRFLQLLELWTGGHTTKSI